MDLFEYWYESPPVHELVRIYLTAGSKKKQGKGNPEKQDLAELFKNLPKVKKLG